MRHVTVVSLFPDMFRAIADHGMSRRAIESGALLLELVNPREFVDDAYRRIDDRPYGGGPGMIMMAEPLHQAIAAARARMTNAKVVFLSPQGVRLDQAMVRRIANGPDLILLCGRYEGVDERLIRRQVDEEWSIGDYVLAGGELAAMVVLEAAVRLMPGVLGNPDSVNEESFSNGLLDCRHFTRPEVWRGEAVPEVLLGGHHEAIRRWRLEDAVRRTRLRRPDLLLDAMCDDEIREFLDKLDTLSIEAE